MKIEQRMVPVRELFAGYLNNDDEGGVVGYGGHLNIRPPYQREFVYKDRQRDEVVRTVLSGLPLNVMYWYAVHDGDVDFEVLDGQQRTISLCEYLDGSFSVDGKYYFNLPEDVQERILSYKLFVYICDGTPSERLSWFRIINIAGERLTDQELRNATYAGLWVSDAKRYFSKTNGPAAQLAGDYVKGTPNRQEVLETAIRWALDADESDDAPKSIEDYMGIHQHENSAQPLWSYFRSVIEWVQAVFPTKRPSMKGVGWGYLYNAHHTRDLDPDELGERVTELLADDDVTRKSGVYEYVLTGKESLLSIRTFSKRDKEAAYERQRGKCAKCKKHFIFEDMQGDHIKPWSKGGHTVPENCQMLCADCNRRKSDV